MARVLVVDDHAVLRHVIVLILSQIDPTHEVFEAMDGREALKLARMHRFDLAITDLDIPHVNGLELISRLKRINPSTAVLVLSGFPAPNHVDRAIQAGAIGFMDKALTAQQIKQGIEAVMAGYNIFPASVVKHSASDSEPEKLSSLSSREFVILRMLVNGMSNKEIGDHLCISNKTVSVHKSRIMEKLQLFDIRSLIDFSRRHGISHPELE